MTNYLPIRKVCAAGVAFGITVALRALHVDLGPEIVNEAAQGLIAVGTAYLVKDPRVQAIGREVAKAEKIAAEHPALTAELHVLAERFLASHAKAHAAIDAAYAKATEAEVSATQAVEKVQTV